MWKRFVYEEDIIKEELRFLDGEIDCVDLSFAELETS
jgi:hypothetical protein